MKKNVMMRVAALLLVCVLASTCGISGTFAKYVTSKSSSTTARVARWGVEFVTESENLFQPQYAYETIPNGVTGTMSVNANMDVVAPGTSGTGYSFTTACPVGGQPEVSYEVTFEAADGFETVYVNDYYPIIYTLKLGEYAVSTRNMVDLMNALASCRYMFDVAEGLYYVSTDNGANWTQFGNSAPTLQLSWKWEFYTNADTDVFDTMLGNLAAGYTAEQVGADFYNLDIAFTISATAAQIN